jgi:single stranded DNA-binding protein
VELTLSPVSLPGPLGPGNLRIPAREGASALFIGDTLVTVAGNLTGDPDLRYTPPGVAVAAFTVAASRRVYSNESSQWKDSDTLFLRCSVWRQLAEHSAESLQKGTRVVVTGRLHQREYEASDGQKRSVYEVDAGIGPHPVSLLPTSPAGNQAVVLLVTNL